MIDAKDIVNGSMHGGVVYVCDYRKPDKNKKAIRNVAPTKVIIIPSDHELVNTSVYYSDSVFSVLDKNDRPTKKIIKLFDNTGNRSYTGVPLKVFKSYDDCVRQWNKDIKEMLDWLGTEKETAIERIDNEIESYKSMLK